jgi:ABC-type uncharacterized transport system, permease component
MKIIRRIIAFCGVYLFLFYVLGLILKAVNLQFRPWLRTLAIPIIGTLLITGLILLIKKLSKLSNLAGIVSLIAGLILGGTVLLYTVFFTAFAHSPEHVVERDGKKMLAVVTSWTDTNADYHLYKNWFVMGKDWLISEYYGSGSFDPFEQNSQPRSPALIPKRTTYNNTVVE